jgi:hypothetical protein
MDLGSTVRYFVMRGVIIEQPHDHHMRSGVASVASFFNWNSERLQAGNNVK